jgi:hypothetical protein
MWLKCCGSLMSPGSAELVPGGRGGRRQRLAIGRGKQSGLPWDRAWAHCSQLCRALGVRWRLTPSHSWSAPHPRPAVSAQGRTSQGQFLRLAGHLRAKPSGLLPDRPSGRSPRGQRDTPRRGIILTVATVAIGLLPEVRTFTDLDRRPSTRQTLPAIAAERELRSFAVACGHA